MQTGAGDRSKLMRNFGGLKRLSFSWSGRPGSNRRHSAWEADVLPLNYSRSLQSIIGYTRHINESPSCGRNCSAGVWTGVLPENFGNDNLQGTRHNCNLGYLLRIRKRLQLLTVCNGLQRRYLSVNSGSRRARSNQFAGRGFYGRRLGWHIRRSW